MHFANNANGIDGLRWQSMMLIMSFLMTTRQNRVLQKYTLTHDSISNHTRAEWEEGDRRFAFIKDSFHYVCCCRIMHEREKEMEKEGGGHWHGLYYTHHFCCCCCSIEIDSIIHDEFSSKTRSNVSGGFAIFVCSLFSRSFWFQSRDIDREREMKKEHGSEIQVWTYDTFLVICWTRVPRIRVRHTKCGKMPTCGYGIRIGRRKFYIWHFSTTWLSIRICVYAICIVSRLLFRCPLLLLLGVSLPVFPHLFLATVWIMRIFPHTMHSVRQCEQIWKWQISLYTRCYSQTHNRSDAVSNSNMIFNIIRSIVRYDIFAFGQMDGAICVALPHAQRRIA